MRVGYALEERLPVLLDLLSATEASIWMNGLLAPVVRIEAREKCLQVMLIHRIVQALEDFLRIHFILPMALSAPSLRGIRALWLEVVAPRTDPVDPLDRDVYDKSGWSVSPPEFGAWTDVDLGQAVHHGKRSALG